MRVWNLKAILQENSLWKKTHSQTQGMLRTTTEKSSW